MHPDRIRRGLDEDHETSLAAAFLVLHAVPPAVPVLPGDPLEVLDLEQEERDDPERDAGLRHEARFLPDRPGS